MPGKGQIGKVEGWVMNLKELAKILDLSQTTVSRALNGYPEVGPATRERVLAAAERFDYRPNARAKGLATGRANAIGHVISISNKRETLNPIFGDFMAGANEVYFREGYDMTLSLVADESLGEMFQAFKTRGAVDGVILHWPTENDPRIALLNEIGLPFVVHGRVSGATQPYCWVDVNNRRAFLHATEYLLESGHRRIALVNGREVLDFAANRRAGYEEALNKRGIAIDPALITSDEMTEGYGFAAASAMLSGQDPPTAFLASSVLIAWGIRRAAETRNLKIGRDVSVITHDDALYYMENGGDPPVFTAMRSSVRRAGNIAAEIMIRRIRNSDGEFEHQLIESDFIIGTSTAPRRPV